LEKGPKFNKSGLCYLTDKDGDRVVLHEGLWSKKISRPERNFLEYNYSKIQDTVKNPDHIRKSK